MQRSRSRRAAAIPTAAALLLASACAGCAGGGARVASVGEGSPRRPADGLRPAAGEPPRAVSDGGRRPRSAAAGRGDAASSELRRLISLGRPIYCGGPHGNEIALTFDDGPGPYTRLAIRKLRSYGDRATFFVVGRNIPLIPGITRRERALGAVGDHTYTHPLLTAIPAGQAEREIVRTKAALARASGGPVRLFRPPYGGHNARIDAIAHAHGLLQVLWSVDSADSLGADYAQIARNVTAGLRPGAIVLMHENRGQTIRALRTILPRIRRRRLRAVSVPQLLRDDPPSLAQVRAGERGCGVRPRSPLGGD